MLVTRSVLLEIAKPHDDRESTTSLKSSRRIKMLDSVLCPLFECVTSEQSSGTPLLVACRIGVVIRGRRTNARVGFRHHSLNSSILDLFESLVIDLLHCGVYRAARLFLVTVTL